MTFSARHAGVSAESVMINRALAGVGAAAGVSMAGAAGDR
jgi:hypothetical protein